MRTLPSGVSCVDGEVHLLEQVLKNRAGAAERNWAQRLKRVLIVDAQSVKNTDTAGSKGYDAGKKVSGIAILQWTQGYRTLLR